MNNPKPGFNFTPEYQSSGLPWALSGSVSTTAVCYETSLVTRAVTVANNSPSGNFLLFGFTRNGTQLGTNSFALDGGKSQRFEVRVRDLWFRGQNSTVNFTVLAELTTIERSKMPPLTGSASSFEASSSFVYDGVG